MRSAWSLVGPLKDSFFGNELRVFVYSCKERGCRKTSLARVLLSSCAAEAFVQGPNMSSAAVVAICCLNDDALSNAIFFVMWLLSVAR